MSEIKAGDKVYFQGYQGEVMRVTQDENEPLLEVALTQSRVTYLNPSQLDLHPVTEKLNENQQIVLGQLKINAGSNGSLIKAIHSLFNLLTISSNQLEKDCTEGLLKSKNALARLTRKQAAEVLSAFAQWSLEQEEE
ncbi:hypothetical protein [Enterococcus gallinarum]|uniref:hypothetical protein n=1 Tax=Enterococcus TaxID=1350 RepID=UPI003F773A50